MGEGCEGNIADSPLRSALLPSAGPSCEHTSCMSSSNFLSSQWESRVGHSFPATISSYSLMRPFPHSSPPPNPFDSSVHVVCALLREPLARGRCTTAYFLLGQRRCSEKRLQRGRCSPPLPSSLPPSPPPPRSLSFILLLSSGGGKKQSAISIMAKDEMVHACVEERTDVGAACGGGGGGKRRGRFGDFAYDLFGKRANPEL